MTKAYDVSLSTIHDGSLMYAGTPAPTRGWVTHMGRATRPR